MSSVFKAGTPYGKAHEHADRAELLYARGDYDGAAEEHLRAADTYLKAIDACEDPSVKHSLRLMHEDHLKLSREAQRARQERTRRENDLSYHERPSDLTATVTMGQVPRRMVDSASSSEHTTIEDSYMMLGGRPGEHNEAFDQFWKTLEGMLENLSQPVAFATAPLDVAAATNSDEKSAVDDGGSDSDASSNDSFCIIDSDSHDAPKKAKHTSSAGSPSGTTKKLKSKPLPDPALARSVYPPPPRVQQLEVENAALKAELEKTVMRVTLAERTLRQRAGQELALRESILSVRREAQRAMSATTAALRSPGFAGQAPSRTQTLIASPSITAAAAIIPPAPAPAVKLPAVSNSRIAELEEEVRQLKAENEKQKAQMAKYRERWEKLKESAKRKRAAKDVKDSQNTTIPEEQEPEPEADAGADPVERRHSAGASIGESGPDPPPPGRPVSGLSSHGVLRSPDSIVTGLALH